MNESEAPWPASARPAAGNLTARLAPLPTLAALETEWRELEARSAGSVCLSWHWIGCWLDCIPQRAAAELLRVQSGGRTVGLAVVCRRTTWRHAFVRSRGLHLNCTGDPLLDEINIEHNGMLAEAGSERPVLEAALRLLLERPSRWDELHLPGLGAPEVLATIEVAGRLVRRRNEGPCRYVDLDALRASGKPHRDSLGRSTRYNVRRSQREYALMGDLEIDVARTADEAADFLARLQVLHQRYWSARGQPGSFANSFFSTFHERLVRTAFPAGVIQLLRIRAGEHDIGYLYNFVHRRRVYNYQSGFDYGEGGNLHRRPGMVAHSLAIDHNAALGASTYDFLAGDSDFKRSFATASTSMAWCVVQRPRAMFRIEDGLRMARNRLLGTTRKRDGAAGAGVGP